MQPGTSDKRLPAYALMIGSASWAGLMALLTILRIFGLNIDEGITVGGPFLSFVSLVVFCGYHAVIFFGARAMLHGGSEQLAYAAAILSLIPCCSPWVVIGIPFGILALMALSKDKAAQGQGPRQA